MPRTLAVFGIAVGVWIVALGFTTNGATTATGVVVAVILFACLIPVSRFVGVRRYTRLFKQWASPGMVVATRFDSDRIAVKTSLSEYVMAYSAFEKIEVRSDIVFLKRASQRLYSMFPIEVVPVEAQATIRARLHNLKA